MKACAKNASSLLLGLLLLGPASAGVAFATAPAPARCLPKVEKAWIRAAPLAATTLAGYAVIRNDCGRPLVITGAKSPDFMMAQVHETKMVDGSMEMRHSKRTTLPVGNFELSPGKFHLMLMHPRRAMPEGKVVHVQFLLEDGRILPADFTVRKAAP
jgi:copper(I)-binding protein